MFKPLLYWIFYHPQSSLNVVNRDRKYSETYCLKRIQDLYQRYEGINLARVLIELCSHFMLHGTENKVTKEGSRNGSCASSSISLEKPHSDSCPRDSIPSIPFFSSPSWDHLPGCRICGQQVRRGLSQSLCFILEQLQPIPSTMQVARSEYPMTVTSDQGSCESSDRN